MQANDSDFPPAQVHLPPAMVYWPLHMYICTGKKNSNLPLATQVTHLDLQKRDIVLESIYLPHRWKAGVRFKLMNPLSTT